MTDQITRPNVSRRRMLQVATILPAAAAVGTLAVASPAHAVTVKRSVTIERARNWFDRDIQYNMGATARDVDQASHQYRRDCSGFVSMCLHSSTSGGGHSTRTLPNIATQIRWRDLRPGDFLNSYDNHCMLFDSWSITTGWLWMWDLANPELDMRHKRIDANVLQNQNYKPYKYDNIVNG